MSYISFGRPEESCVPSFYLSFVGGGQFGSVWKGKCRGVDVAIKYLENFNQDKLRDFLDEVQIMSKVLNPHVVLLLGACTVGPTSEWCMVTELCSRGDLENLLYNPETKLSWNKKFSFAIDICLGLSWLNGKEMQVTHHDLKPANGKYPRIYLMLCSVCVPRLEVQGWRFWPCLAFH